MMLMTDEFKKEFEKRMAGADESCTKVLLQSMDTMTMAQYYLTMAEMATGYGVKIDTKRAIDEALEEVKHELQMRGDWHRFERCWAETREEFVPGTGTTRWEMFQQKFRAAAA